MGAAAALLVFLLAPLPGRQFANERPFHPQTDPFSCPVEGIGGDLLLNRLKNRTAEPGRYEPITFEEILKLPSEAFAAKLPRRRWPRWWADKIATQEGRAVVIEGTLMEARQMGVESCNCRDVTLRDIHFAIAEKPDDPRALWLVTELTPRVRESRPAWHLKRLRALVKRKSRVRLSGWLLYDDEHLNLTGRTRISPWEIHPVMRIEVMGPDGFAPL